MKPFMNPLHRPQNTVKRKLRTESSRKSSENQRLFIGSKFCRATSVRCQTILTKWNFLSIFCRENRDLTSTAWHSQNKWKNILVELQHILQWIPLSKLFLRTCDLPPPHNQIYSRNWHAFSMLQITKFPPPYGGGLTFYYTKQFLNRFNPHVHPARPTHGPRTGSKTVRIWPEIE